MATSGKAKGKDKGRATHDSRKSGARAGRRQQIQDWTVAATDNGQRREAEKA